MDKDIVPELLELIHKAFDDKISDSTEYKNLIKVLNNNKASEKDAFNFAKLIGTLKSQVFGETVTEEVLPDGHMYWNIGHRLFDDVLRDDYSRITEYVKQVLSEMNQHAGININGIDAPFDEDKLRGLADMADKHHSFNETKDDILEAIITNAKGVYDDMIRENARFQYEAGLSPKIIRTTSGKACNWCRALAGTYDYYEVSDTGNDVFRRHANCDCLVAYSPRKGKYQNVHNKNWINEKEYKNNITDRITFSNEVPVLFTSLEEKTEEQIQAIAEHMNALADKYVPEKPQKWNGKILFHSNGYSMNFDGTIMVADKANEHILLHELMHGKSIAWFNKEMYKFYHDIEEASVEFLAEEICKKEGLQLASGGWGEEANLLREIGHYLGKTDDFSFAKELFIIDVPDRLDWIIQECIKGNFSEDIANQILGRIEKLKI